MILKLTTKTLQLIALIAVITMLGCQSVTTTENVSSAQFNDKANAADIKFETSQDPPINSTTYFAAGQLAESQSNFPTAVDQYWKAYKADRACTQALFRLGILHAKQEQYSAAVVAWKEYIKATDGNATGYGNLGFCYELANLTSEAEEAYKAGIARDPQNNLCRVNYGLMLARFNRIGESLLNLQAVLTPAEAHYNIGSVFEQQGKKDRAMVEYRKAKDLDPEFNDADSRMSTIK